MKRVCVFCGSNPGARPEYAEAARSVGRTLAKRGLGVVFGGGSVGLMAETANAALAEGGQVIGIIPGVLVEKELAHTGVTELRVVESMHERKAMMAELSDAFIALPGGWGTLEELFETVTWAQLGFHEKPVGLLNVLGYYDGLLRFLDQAVEAGFLKAEHRALLLLGDSPEALLDTFASYRAPREGKWIDRKAL
jgi:uncharacterized protein (TIGR00730 family)